MIVRQATEHDLKQIADVHIQCFPDSFSTQLGKAQGGDLQQQFYLEYLNDNPELFLVSENNKGNIVGFCMGYYLEKRGQMRRYMKSNFFKVGLRILQLLVMANKPTWRKLRSVFVKKYPFRIVNDSIQFQDCEVGDLLSICVLPEYRGNGAAQKMIEEYQEVLKNRGRKVCLLTVAMENGRGVRFYERNGFVPYRETDDGVRTYAKYL